MLADLGAMPRQTKKPPRIARPGREALALLREKLTRLAGDNMKRYGLAAGLGTTFVRDVVAKQQDPGISKLVTLARHYNLSIDELVGLDHGGGGRTETAEPIKVIGEVGAGKWHELDGFAQLDFERETSPLPADPRYPAAAQFDLTVRGSSINKFARDSMKLRCVDLARAGVEPYDNDLVIVRRTRAGGLVETTAKILRRKGAVIELWPDSDDPKWQEPQRIDVRKPPEDESGGIVGLVLYAYNPARGR